MAVKKRYGMDTYIDGNTVRRVAMPAEPDYRREREERKRREHQRRNKQVARRNREKAEHMSLGYVAFLSAAVMVTAFVSVTYIQLQTSVTSHLKTISSLESQVADLKADNDAAYKRISTAVNVNQVKDVAMNQLGMVYPSKDQIVYYSVDAQDYMNQYSEIPD